MVFGEGKQGVRVLFVTVMVVVGVLAVYVAPALAVPPETPRTEHALGVRATSANLFGILDPGKEGVPGTYGLETYEFVYRASTKDECKGVGEIVTSAGLAVGAGKEEVVHEVEGLTPGTTYAVCLVAHNEADTESAAGAPVSFTTAIPPEVPEGERAVEVTGSAAKLEGVVNPKAGGEPGFYRFSYAPSAAECTGAESISAPPEPGEPTLGQEGEAVGVLIANLLPDTRYTFCLFARNGVNEEVSGVPVTFTTLTAAPAVSEETARDVGPSSATVRAEISPGGLVSSYDVEYATETQFLAQGWTGAASVPAPDGELSASRVPVSVSETLTGLQPDTAYRFRFVAANECEAGKRCVAEGAEATFTTTSVLASGLPDRRAYELVSTAGGNTGEPYSPTAPEYGFETSTRQLFQAAENGEAVAYLGEPPATGGNGGTGGGEGNEWLARRSAEGWKTEVITPSGSEVGGIFQAFSSDLSTGFMQTDLLPSRLEPAPTPALPETLDGCQILYSRAGAGHALTALFSSTQTPKFCGHPLFAGASADDSRVVFQSEAALTPEAQEATEADIPSPHSGHQGGAGSEGGQPCTFGCNLYEAVGGRLRLVNVLPGPSKETVPDATFGGFAPESSDKTDLSNVISTDGSRIFWTDTQAEKNGEPDPDMEHIYVLENGTEEVQVSGAGPAQYWTATPDGHYVYYTENGELWRFDTSAEAEPEPRKALASKGINGENAGVLGVIGTNETGADGAYLYFVANGVLAANKGASGETASPGAPNLYLRHEGVNTFIATLAPEDNTSKAGGATVEDYGDWAPSLGARTAEVAPDGRHVVFESIERLTGYDNLDTAPGEPAHPATEVFVYDAGSEQLACASCAPSGVAPQIAQERDQTLLPISSESNTSMRRWMSESGGRVFFDSKQPLVSQDENGGVQDVYEWEREGEGSCTVQAKPRLNLGCVYVISGGGSEDFSFLVDADATGANVFFTHRGPLGGTHVPVEQNELLDARVNGGITSVSEGCKGEGCQTSPPAPPPFTVPSSATFTGVGNFPQVPPVKKKATKKTVKKKARCAKAKKRNKHGKCVRNQRRGHR